MQPLTLTGAIDGINATFTLPIAPSYLALYRNGIRQSNYTLTSNVVTFAAGSIPQPGDTLIAGGE